MDGELIVGLTNFSDAGHTYYEKLRDFKELKKPLTYIKNGFEKLETVLRQELCLS